MVGTEQGLDAVLFARVRERDPVLPGHPLLPLDHQREAHRGGRLAVRGGGQRPQTGQGELPARA